MLLVPRFLAEAATDQFTHSLIWMFVPLIVLAGLVEALGKGRKRRGRRPQTTNRNGSTSSRRSHWVDDLVLGPWWVSFALAVLLFIFLPRLIPAASFLSEVLGSFFLFLSLMSVLRKWKTRLMLDEQTSLASIVDLPWKQFEDLLGEAYRRQGYKVEETLGGGPDGGVDLVLRRDGQMTLVQCKRWRGKPVPVQTVRELYGILHDRKASSAMLVATTHFTTEAIAFANNKPIELVDSEGLLRLIRSVQRSGKMASLPPPLPSSHVPPDCPRCGSTMVVRTAKHGAKAGEDFWGCSNFQNTGCRGKREI